MPLEGLPVFLEVGPKGSQVEVICGTKSVLGIKHTGFSGYICHHPARWCGSISHAESTILNTLCALPQPPEISSLWSSGRLCIVALVNLQVWLLASSFFSGLCCCTPLQLMIGRFLALQVMAQSKENQGLGEFPRPALEMLRQHMA